MTHSKSSSRRRIRVGWLAASLAFLVLASAAGYFAYQRQKIRNTQRLLHDARQAQQAGEMDRAIETYGLYLERTPADTEVLRTYSGLLHERLPVSRRWLGPTIRALRELNRMDPGDAQTMARLTGIYMDLGEFALAQEIARSWVEVAPNEPDAVLMLARASHGNNKNEIALKLLADAANLNPSEPRYYPPLVDLLSNVFQRKDEAAEWIRRGLQNAPSSVEVQLAAFQFFKNRHQTEAARLHLDRALDLAPDSPEVLISGANFFVSQGDLQRAGALLDRAASLHPDAPGLLAARRVWAINSRDPENMITVANDLQRAAQTADLALLAQAAELYLRAGALPQADGCMKSLESGNTASLTKGTLDSLRGARALMADQPFAAIASLENAIRQQPSDLWTLELLSRAFLRTGALDEAADLYRRLALLAPAAAAPRLALARLEIQNHNFQRAREILASIGSPVEGEIRQAKLLSILIELKQPQSPARAQAVSELEAIASQPAADLASHEIIIHAFLEAGLANRAMETWTQWTGDSSTHDRMALDIGRRLIANRDLDAAAQWIAKLQERNAKSTEAKRLHCELLLARGVWQDASNFVNQLSESPEVQGLLWETLADNAPDPNMQRSAMTKAAQLRTADIGVRQKLARLLNDLPEAQKLVDEIRAIEGDNGIQWKFERASILLRLDNTPQAAANALTLLRECLDVRSGWTAARGLLGFAYEKMGALPEAVESYRAALTLNPDLATHTIAFRLIDTLKRLGRYAEADAALTPIARAMPDSVDVQRLITEQLVRRHDMTSAAQVAEQVLRLTPNDPSWAAATADLHLRANDPARAEQTARDALTRNPDSLSLLSSLSRALLAQGKKSDAEQLVRKVADEKKSASFDILLARVLVECLRADEAGSVLEGALAREPQNAMLLASIAEFWGAQGDRERQHEFIRRTLLLRGEDPGQSLWLAAFLASGSPAQRDEAAAIVRRRMTTQPGDADALLLDAQLALTQDPPDGDRAQESLTAALKINPQALSAHKLLAAVLIQKGDGGAADEAIAAGLLVAPDDPDLLVLSAEVRQLRGDFEHSLTPLRRLISSPQPPLRAYDLLADAAIGTHQIDQAIDSIEKLEPRPLEVTLVLARLYEAKNNIEKARELLRNVAEKSPSAGMPPYLLFLARRGDFEQIASFARDDAPGGIPILLTAAELLAAQAPDSSLRQRGFEILERIAAAQPAFAADARFRAGLAHLRHKDLINAETMLLNASQLAPLNPKPVNALAWLYGEEMGEPQRGLDLLTKFENSGGRASAEMLDTHGSLLLKVKRYPEAMQKLTECLRISGQTANRTSALYHLALVQTETGAPQDAATNLKSALQLNDRVGGLTPRQAEEIRKLLNALASSTQP